jgi:hypothetical protein
MSTSTFWPPPQTSSGVLLGILAVNSQISGVSARHSRAKMVKIYGLTVGLTFLVKPPADEATTSV